jgi:hypothetical protein
MRIEVFSFCWFATLKDDLDVPFCPGFLSHMYLNLFTPFRQQNTAAAQAAFSQVSGAFTRPSLVPEMGFEC